MNILKVGSYIEHLVEFLLDNFEPVFSAISVFIQGFIDVFEYNLLIVPPIIVTVVLALIALILAGKKVSLFTFSSLVFVFYTGIWIPFIQTFVLVLVSAVFSLLMGIPAGILASKYNLVDKCLTPVLDFMQTMPPFVYLIPASILFGIGEVPGIISTIIFSMPPCIRLTKLGLTQVPKELEEVGHSFGLTNIQLLRKIKLPMAMPSIMAGINQSIMLSLSMVVISSMIGAKGLGKQVLEAIQRMDIALGFEAGLGVVILAIILDRITGGIKLKNNV